MAVRVYRCTACLSAITGTRDHGGLKVDSHHHLKDCRICCFDPVHSLRESRAATVCFLNEPEGLYYCSVLRFTARIYASNGEARASYHVFDRLPFHFMLNNMSRLDRSIVAADMKHSCRLEVMSQCPSKTEHATFGGPGWPVLGYRTRCERPLWPVILNPRAFPL